MIPKLKWVAAAALCFGSLAAPALAAGLKPSPAGAWQTSDGQARVKVTMCGDGTALCARLTALSGKARTSENLRMLITYVVEGAQMTGQNIWLGKVHFNGQTADGHITMVSANAITVSGCQLGMCKTLDFRRLTAMAAARPLPNVTPVATTAAVADASQIRPRTVSLTLAE